MLEHILMKNHISVWSVKKVSVEQKILKYMLDHTQVSHYLNSIFLLSTNILPTSLLILIVKISLIQSKQKILPHPPNELIKTYLYSSDRVIVGGTRI